MKKRNRKKGAEKIMSVYWFAILFIVAAAIVYMVAAFYGKPYDVRNTEAELLADKIADCVSYAGYMRDGVMTQDFKTNLLQNCNITFNVEDQFGWKQQEQYFLEIDFYDFGSYPGQSVFNASAGNSNLKDLCSLNGGKLPLCLSRQMYVIDKQGKQYIVNIFTIIGKVEKNE